VDLDTFLTTVYVIVDDWYKANMAARMQRKRGGKLAMSDSEVLTIALVGQWRVGTSWRSERGVVRYFQTVGRRWFPTMVGRSAFNQRVRNLWAALVCLQQTLAAWLQPQGSSYECVDCVPLRACSLAQSRREGGHWWWWSRYGHGGTQGSSYFGDQIGMSVTPNGAITGWLVSDAQVDDRWVLQALLRQRMGQPYLTTPPPSASGKNRHGTPPSYFPSPALAAGRPWGQTYLADAGFGGGRWYPIWRQCRARVLTPPPANAPDAWSRPALHWHRRLRQPIETTFAHLTTVFSLASVRAHSRWGQFTCLAAMFAAYNLGLWLNHLQRRPLHALATLLP
jgi:hypothetical protein